MSAGEETDAYALGGSFRGGVEGRAIPGGRARARLSLGPEGLLVEPESGAALRLDWSGMRLSRGGASGQVVFCKPAQGDPIVFCEGEGFLRAVEAAGGNAVADELARLAGERVAGKWRHRVLLAASLLLVVLAVRAVPGLFRDAIRLTVANIPTSVDREVGRAVWESMADEGRLVRDPELRAFLDELLHRLEPTGEIFGERIELRLVDDPEANAFALPGGFLTVYSGLLREAEAPEEVAGVLAHELAHVELRHGLARITHSLGTWTALRILLGDTSGLVGIARDLFQLATVNDYSQEQESEADALGVARMHRAGLDPLALARFFERLQERMGDLPSGLAWTSTHPLHAERIRAVRAEVERLGPARLVPLDVDWESLRAKL